MKDKKSRQSQAPGQDKSVNLGRHEYQCTICSHSQRGEIEQAFVDWVSPSRVARQHSVSRDSIYRHAHALGLMEKRDRNLRAALYPIIERAGEVKVNAPAVVTAITALARINSRGQWVERTENVDLNDLFERMTNEELDAYARDGVLPKWFDATSGATRTGGQGGADEA